MNEETISLSNFTAHNWFSFISAVNSVEKHASLICHWALCCVLDWRKYPHKTKTLEFINLNIDCVMKTKHSGKVHISITLSLFKMNTRLALFNFKSILNVKSIPPSEKLCRQMSKFQVKTTSLCPIKYWASVSEQECESTVGSLNKKNALHANIVDWGSSIDVKIEELYKTR